MKVFQWNINKGGKPETEQTILSTVLQSKPDVVVLSEFQKAKDNLAEVLRQEGYISHIPASDYQSGNQVAAFSKRELNFETQPIEIPLLEGLTIFLQNPQWVIGGVFFPKKGKSEPSIHPFWDWLNGDNLNLSQQPTIFTGDFNYGVRASDWNKGTVGSEYRAIQRWIEQGKWIDCAGQPDPGREYVKTYCRNKLAELGPEQKWPTGSSRPDHFFVSNCVEYHSIQVLEGAIAAGLSDHEPMTGEFEIKAIQ